MASRGINKVILVGNLGSDPEVRYTPDGKAITSLSVATSDSWKDKNTGQMQERTEWHRVVIFGGLASVAGEYLRKGSQVYLEGKLQTRKWQDQGGQDRYTTEVVVDGFGGQMQMLGGRTGGDTAFQPQQGGQQNFNQGMSSQAPQQNFNQGSQQAPNQQNFSSAPAASSPAAAPFDDMDDDIPF